MKRHADRLLELIWPKRVLTASTLYATMAIVLPAQTTLTTLHLFSGTDGEQAQALIQATNGDFYGVTAEGGPNPGTTGSGAGTVFEISASGTFTTLYSFCSQTACADGEGPYAPLVQALDGNLYGSTPVGGSASCAFGCGTIFKITPAGTLTTVYRFCSESGCADGEGPSELVQGTNGDLYGTTGAGGEYGLGTIFRITPGAVLTTLFSFSSGEFPTGLIQGSNGNLYGTTLNGGQTGYGTIFSFTPSGTFATLYTFCSQIGCTDGKNPTALVQATNGNLYGTTGAGGANAGPSGTGAGTVFRITPEGSLTTLYNFCSQSGCADGFGANGRLVQANDGDFYGTTEVGGGCEIVLTSGCGTVFKLTPGGKFSTIYTFCSDGDYPCADGFEPQAGLVQATNGDFYGTTTYGGTGLYYGTVFSLSVGLRPFVKTQPGAAKVGSLVEILGTGLTGATSVKFNGTKAPFKVISGSLIAAQVPTGATTGKIEVVTPSATLSSYPPFRVYP